MTHRWLHVLWPVLALAMLTGVTADKALFQSPRGDAEPHHARVRAAVEAMPNRIGDWVGEEVAVPPAAVALLRPNAILSRQYRNVQTGEEAGLLLVQCGDARDLLGHYPPVCYVAHGWVQQRGDPRSWNIAGHDIEAMEYEFTRESPVRPMRIIIYDFMALPSGRTARDMDEVNNAARGYRRKFYGAAQVQVVLDSNIAPPRRDEIFQTLMAANTDVLNAIMSGDVQ